MCKISYTIIPGSAQQELAAELEFQQPVMTAMPQKEGLASLTFYKITFLLLCHTKRQNNNA
jgi:hypothetical protein